MHKIEMPQWAIDRSMERRGKLHVHDDLDPRKTALDRRRPAERASWSRR